MFNTFFSFSAAAVASSSSHFPNFIVFFFSLVLSMSIREYKHTEKGKKIGQNERNVNYYLTIIEMR